MRRALAILSSLLLILSVPACDGKENPVLPSKAEDARSEDQEDNSREQTETTMTIRITAGGKTFTADIEDNQTGKAFIAKLPLTLEMSELNGNEKYCYGVELPRADQYYDTIAAGDLMLYSGNRIVLFYGSAGGYSYTRIGKLSSTDGLSSALGSSKVTVLFEKQQ